MNVIGHEIIKGVPHINGRAAKWDENNSFPDIFSSWICPDCNSHLAKDGFICLNACHLTVRQYKEFQSGIIDAQRRVEFRAGRTDFVNIFEDE